MLKSLKKFSDFTILNIHNSSNKNNVYEIPSKQKHKIYKWLGSFLDLSCPFCRNFPSKAFFRNWSLHKKALKIKAIGETIPVQHIPCGRIKPHFRALKSQPCRVLSGGRQLQRETFEIIQVGQNSSKCYENIFNWVNLNFYSLEPERANSAKPIFRSIFSVLSTKTR